ncbi:hypothetical protein PRUPE_4G122700 [Prunus persica]|uniref:Uncharacterized protein n=1 Tax=Prunus persica TaxID=3760 RepID=M5WP80_PRUPE|nr:hypothetical protein PRUPE_4G122700 [Prunus persica]
MHKRIKTSGRKIYRIYRMVGGCQINLEIIAPDSKSPSHFTSFPSSLCTKVVEFCRCSIIIYFYKLLFEIQRLETCHFLYENIEYISYTLPTLGKSQIHQMLHHD